MVAILLLMSLISYSANDPSWSHVSTSTAEVSNLAGAGGAWLADILYTFLGAASWWLVVIACYEGWRVWCERTEPQGALRSLGYIFLMIATAAFTGLLALSWLSQGIMGQLVGQGLSGLLSHWGALLFTLAFILMTLTFTFNLNWRKVLQPVLAKVRKQSDMATKSESKAEQQPATDTEAPIIQGQQLPLTLSGEIDATVDSRASSIEKNATVVAQASRAEDTNRIINTLEDSPLDAFLDESGFSRAKEYQWLEENDATTPFKPVSADHIANTKLTKKLDARLHNETIAPIADPTIEAAQQAKSQWVNPTPTEERFELNFMATPESSPSQPTDSADEADYGFVFGRDTRDAPPIEPPPDEPHEIENAVSYSFGNEIHNEIKEVVPDTADIAPYDDTRVNDASNVIHEDKLQSTDPVVQSVAEILGMRTVKPVSLSAEPVNLPDAPVVSDKTENDNSDSLTVIPTVEALSEQDTLTADIAPVTDEPLPSVTPVSSRPVEVDELKPIDIHDDALFATQSRAMQTAAYRASLSPLPDMSLLELPDPERKPVYSREQLQQLSELLEIKLQEFNVKAEVVNAQLGPVVTRFEVALAPGVKASKVTGIAKDLARSLSMASVRVVEVIPGKPYIGIEVPNPKRQMVRLIELLQTDAYRDPDSMISMAMGKDIAGKPIIADLGKAPHMLVAGTTGSGKSVLVNSLLLSMLLKYTPQQLRLILIDPKQLELANYNDIPHLLTPVVTDMTEAASALSWCVAEMERRYQLMSLFKVRKLDEFNKKVLAADAQGHPLLDPLWRVHDSVSQDKPPKLKPLPQIVIVADEFADMIMQVGKQAEELITRLAQKSRAAGIHLILATQRPSVDVITGLIKANIPVRAALRVNSKVDSRTILDAGGAEDMLGHGDMLFLGPGQIEPTRVHGAFISDAEVNLICDAWRERGAPDYIDNMFDNFQLTAPSGGSDSSSGIATGDEDALYDEVVAFVLETRKVSASSIQRKFSIGYNRAARIVDAMEEAGLVSAMGKSGKRELLV